MSARERERRTQVEVRLAELRARHGQIGQDGHIGQDIDPSWGPVGSLARQQLTGEAYAHLLALHHSMLALERSRKAGDHEPPPPPPPPPPPERRAPPAPAPSGQVFVDLSRG